MGRLARDHVVATGDTRIATDRYRSLLAELLEAR
jgi:hypothetical protein